MSKHPDPMDIKALERQQRAEEAQQQAVRQQHAADINWLMGDARGRRLMSHVLALSGVGRASFTGNSATFYNEGRRAVGVELEADLRDHAFDHYITMLKEQRQ